MRSLPLLVGLAFLVSSCGGSADSEIDALQQRIEELEAVSYTHLTLPTNREV